jgi:hypothetical protein
VVEIRFPADGFAAPVESNISVLLGNGGGAKFALFNILKTSARNCALNVSEIFLMYVFLINEKSKLETPGPMSMLRPALPRRLKHWSWDVSP